MSNPMLAPEVSASVTGRVPKYLYTARATKVKAQQEKEKAETDADKRRVEAQATADADLIAANAEAEKSKVAADAELYVAEKKAEANRALNDSLNSNLLEYYKITDVESRWNGELPAYVGDGNSIPIINGIN